MFCFPQVILRHEEMDRHAVAMVLNAHRAIDAPLDDELSSVLDQVYKRLADGDDRRHY